MRIRPLTVGLAALAVAGVLGAVWWGDYLSPSSAGYAGPSWTHPLGTDRNGRDLLGRLLVATRAFFLPGLAAMLVSFGLGVSLGAAAGWSAPREAWEHRRWWNQAAFGVVRGLASILLVLPSALPRLVAVVLICTALGFDPFVLAITIGALYAGELGEELRQRIEHCSSQEYVHAARADGLAKHEILIFHVLWLQSRKLIARHLVQVWVVVLLFETTLSYLPGGFGVEEPTPSWGNMLSDVAGGARTEPLWPSILLTAVIVTTVATVTALGDRWSSDRIEPGRGEPGT